MVACLPAYRRINPVGNLFLNKMLKHDYDVRPIGARERETTDAPSICCVRGLLVNKVADAHGANKNVCDPIRHNGPRLSINNRRREKIQFARYTR